MENNQQVLELKKEIRLLRQLGTRTGFFQYYFEELPKHRTYVECFHAINEKHFDQFGEYRYESYHSFRNQINAYHKNKK
jgi:hypothetical protein